MSKKGDGPAKERAFGRARRSRSPEERIFGRAKKRKSLYSGEFSSIRGVYISLSLEKQSPHSPGRGKEDPGGRGKGFSPSWKAFGKKSGLTPKKGRAR